jgi:hypothetical protein
MGFPESLASLLLLVSPNVPVVACLAVGPAVAFIFRAVFSSLAALLWQESLL